MLKYIKTVGLASADFLDVTFDLQNNCYKPYWKPDNLPVYIQNTRTIQQQF